MDSPCAEIGCVETKIPTYFVILHEKHDLCHLTQVCVKNERCVRLSHIRKRYVIKFSGEGEIGIYWIRLIFTDF
jgi:hypothetical protein